MCRITCLFQFLLVIVLATHTRNQDIKLSRHHPPTDVLDNGEDIDCNFDDFKLPEALKHIDTQVSPEFTLSISDRRMSVNLVASNLFFGFIRHFSCKRHWRC